MSRMRVFGKASDFYRLRVLKVNEDSDISLDWKKDILFRNPEPSPMSTRTWYVVQVVNIDDEEPYSIKRFKTGEAAMRFKDKAEELLHELTKKQFEEKFPSLISTRQE